MSTTKTTTTTRPTTMMVTNDIPSSDDVVGAAAMGDAGSASIPAPTPAPMPTWSSFALGKKQDSVLEVVLGVVRIKSLSAPDKFVTLRKKRLGTPHVDLR